MSILPILIAPNPILKKTSIKVDKIDDELRTLLDDMLETMYDAPGIGLAAIQVGIDKRVLVMDVNFKNDLLDPTPLKIINPKIISTSDELASYDEGCLSFPDAFAFVDRPAQIKFEYFDENDKHHIIETDGLLAVCIQHEIDHLNGINFVDHISKLKKDMIIKKLIKKQKNK